MSEDGLKTLANWIALKSRIPSANIEAYSEHREQYQQQLRELKTIKEEKNTCSAGFRDADAATKQTLKQTMQSISKRIKAIEADMERLRERALALVTEETVADSVPPFAQHFPKPETQLSSITAFTAPTEDEWNAYAQQHPGSAFCLRADLGRTAAELLGHQFHGLVARDADEKICGVLPLVEMKSRLFGHFLVSVPWFNYGGALADSDAIADSLTQAAQQRYLQGPLTHIELRETRRRPSLPVREDKVSMLLELPDNAENLWQDIGTKLRAQVKRPQSENTRCASGGVELLEDFYRVFAENMRDLGTPVYGKSFFKGLLQTFPDAMSLHIVYRDERPAAAAFLIKHKQLMEIPWASSLKQHNPISINMLLYWHCLKYSIEARCQWFDFGRSTKGAGTYRFKKQWGAEALPHYWHYLMPAGAEAPSINPDNPKFKLLIAVWKRLPVWLSKIIGPPVVANIP